MKFLNALASLGVASASNALQGHITDMLTPAASQLASTPVGYGICQGYDAFNFFSLKHFAALNSVSGGPSSIQGAGNTEFDYALCDIPWKLTDGKFRSKSLKPKEDYAVGECAIREGNVPTSNTAYLVVDGKCQYNFVGATFNGLDYKNGTNHGFEVTWESDKNCPATKKPFEVKLTAECSKTVNKALTLTSTDACSKSISYEGPLGCPTAKLEIERYAALIAPYVGFIIVTVGLIMTFKGAKFIQALGAFLVGLVVCGIVFGMGFTFLPPKHTNLLEMIILLLVGIIIGALAAKAAWELIKTWIVPMMAGFAVAVLVLMLLSLADIENFYLKVVAVFVGILAGAYVGTKLNKIIKTFGTAFIGSFLTVRGSSFFIGGWP